MIKKNDILLIGAVILICLGLLVYLNVTKEAGSKVVITVDGKPYDTLDLSKDTNFTIKGSDGAFNEFQIKDGYVDMIAASCPDLLCVKQKSIHYNHETIVCLPNKVVLEIINSEDSQVDMIAN